MYASLDPECLSLER